jgi:hypothetical protein
MFYFQTLLNRALSGIDGTGIISAVVSVAYAILLVGFLFGLYQAAMRGGDVQALGVTAIKYVVVAVIVANWSAIFHDVNNSFNAVAQYIGNNSGDVFLAWDRELAQQFTSSSTSFWDLISGDISSLISGLFIVIAYILYAVAIVLFSFFYTLYGAVLYVLGPMVLAFFPMGGVGQIGKSFAVNVMIWNAWGIIYAIFGALITAIHINQQADGFGNFLGYLQGPVDSVFLGMISIFYAIAIALIPFIAKRVVSGDVGSTASSLVRAAGSIAGIGVAAAAGLAGGVSAASGTGAGASAGGAGASAGSAGASASAASSTPPPTPSLGQSIRAGFQSAMSSASGPPAPAGGQSGSSGGSGTNGSSPGSSGSAGNGSKGSASPAHSGTSGFSYRPQGVAQQLAYHGARALSKAAAHQSKDD